MYTPAWAHAIKFMTAHKEPDVRAPDVNYETLLEIVPDSGLSESRLHNALQTLRPAR